MPTYYPENNTPASTDGELRVLNKILALGVGATVLHGVGNPNGVVSGTQWESFYVQEDDPDSVWVNTDGGTTWVLVSGGGVAPIIGAGNPNGVTPGTLGQLFIDMANPGHIYVNVDGATGWVLNA